MTAPTRVFIPFPTQWDHRQLAACRAAWSDDYAVAFGEPDDAGCPSDLDLSAWVEATAAALAGRVGGTLSSSDYPGAAAAALLADRLGLPGTPPAALILAAHKYYARQAQQAAVPEAVPPFCLVDPAAPEPAIGFPCFVKPVKAAFSLLARRIEDQASLTALLRSPEVASFFDDYVAMFDRLLAEHTTANLDARRFIAERPLSGFQVTVEGFRQGGETTLLGVVDSVMYPGTRSFARFDYPSFLGAAVQQRMGELAGRAAAALGLEETLFNVEMFYDATADRIWIIEVNPRLCGQFADLYHKVDGVNAYRIALDVACGRRPEVPRRRGRHGCAASYPLRVFEPCRLLVVPDPDDVAAAERAAPDTLVWVEYPAGAELTDFATTEDGYSARYAIVNLGAEDRGRLADRFERVRAALDFGFEPLEGRP